MSDEKWTDIGLALHPRDGEVGRVYRLINGNEVLYTLRGSIRSLPRDWRHNQPSDEILEKEFKYWLGVDQNE